MSRLDERLFLGSKIIDEQDRFTSLLKSYSPSNAYEIQLWTLAYLLVECGVKPSQAVELKGSDFEKRSGTLRIDATWGSEGKILIRLPANTLFWLTRWIEERSIVASSYLFFEDPEKRASAEREDRPISTRSVSRRMGRLAAKIGYKKEDTFPWCGSVDKIAPLIIKDLSEKKEQFVYFFQEIGGEGLIKIGVSWNPKKRRREVELARGRRIQMLCLLRGGARLERQLHAELGDFRVSGEWFLPSEKVMKYVRSSQASSNEQLMLITEPTHD